MSPNTCVFLVTQSCSTLCNAMDCNPPCSSVHGDSPSRNTGVAAMPSSRGSSRPRDWTEVSCVAGGSFPSSSTREAYPAHSRHLINICWIEFKSPLINRLRRLGLNNALCWHKKMACEFSSFSNCLSQWEFCSLSLAGTKKVVALPSDQERTHSACLLMGNLFLFMCALWQSMK